MDELLLELVVELAQLVGVERVELEVVNTHRRVRVRRLAFVAVLYARLLVVNAQQIVRVYVDMVAVLVEVNAQAAYLAKANEHKNQRESNLC